MYLVYRKNVITIVNAKRSETTQNTKEAYKYISRETGKLKNYIQYAAIISTVNFNQLALRAFSLLKNQQ